MLAKQSVKFVNKIASKAEKKLKRSILYKVFLRSFFIQATLNFRRMQNMGFVMSMVPALREWNLSPKKTQEILTRHLQVFNTHTYLSGPVLGSVLRLEEESLGVEGGSDSIAVKQSLMGPYAAIGDTFFWGALRPFAVCVACILAYQGFIIAPLAFLLLYTPAHFLVRFRGFFEGYRRGKQGIVFIRELDLPSVAGRIRWCLLIVLASAASIIATGQHFSSLFLPLRLEMILGVIAIILVCFLLLKRKFSQFYILYGAAIIFFLISLKEL